jgi:hypothetical protein
VLSLHVLLCILQCTASESAAAIDEALELRVLQKLLRCLSQPQWSSESLSAVDDCHSTVQAAITDQQIAKLIHWSELNAAAIDTLPYTASTESCSNYHGASVR